MAIDNLQCLSWWRYHLPAPLAIKIHSKQINEEENINNSPLYHDSIPNENTRKIAQRRWKKMKKETRGEMIFL